MKSGRLRIPLPQIALHVKGIMKQHYINPSELARRMNVRPPTVYRLLKRNDWLASEILLVGELLGVNLFQFYLPQQTREAAEKDALIEAQREELEQLKKENALLREIAGAGK